MFIDNCLSKRIYIRKDWVSLMTTETIIANTKQMIDDLKTVCCQFWTGQNASSEI